MTDLDNHLCFINDVCSATAGIYLVVGDILALSLRLVCRAALILHFRRAEQRHGGRKHHKGFKHQWTEPRLHESADCFELQ